MKIALIDPVGGHGGMDYYDYGLAYGLHKNNMEVHYFTCNETNIQFEKEINTHFVFDTIWRKRKLGKLKMLLFGYFKAFQFARKNSINTIHFQFFHLGIQNVIVLFIARIFGLRRVVTIHDVDSFKNNDSKVLKQIGFKLVSKFIVHNEFSLKELILKGAFPSKISKIPHGNYLSFIKTLDYTPHNKKLKLLFFGQIKDVKGLEILILAMSNLKDRNTNVHLTIAGRPWGTSEAKYIELIQKHKLEKHISTHFEYIPNEKVETFFKESDVVVLPYKKIYQSGVLLLAMSYGRTTLSSDLDAFKEVVTDDETGFIFESESVNALANKIISISENVNLIPQIRENALVMLKTKFNWNEIAKSTIETYIQK